MCNGRALGHHARPRLSVCMLTRDSESRLQRLIDEARCFADEVVIGVDAASTDGTFAVASAHADVAFQFRHPGQFAPARMLPFDYATGDWILSLDDDESIEETFDALVPELLSDARVTHYHFPRKWIVNLEPCEYLRASPWFPDWQLRLFRNDRSLVWKPARTHSGYRVQGAGARESRASLLHFEPVWSDDEARRKKIDFYRQGGSGGACEEFYSPGAGLPRQAATPRGLSSPSRRLCDRRSTGTIHAEIRNLTVASLPPWNATVSRVDMPPTAGAGQMVFAEVVAQNTGRLSWSPPSGRWPDLSLGFHLLDLSGQVIAWDGHRFPMPRVVPPGQAAPFLCAFPAPAVAGDYLLEWDLVSEGECWFAQCGGTVLRTPLEVGNA